MNFTGGYYIGQEGRLYLALYNYAHDIYMMPPPPFEDARHEAHFTYLRGGRLGGADVFSVDEFIDTPLIHINKTVKLGEKVVDVKVKKPRERRTNGKIKKKRARRRIPLSELEKMAENYDARFELVSPDKRIREEVMALSNADIEAFCDGEFAKNKQGTKIDAIDKIVPVTAVKYIDYDPKVGVLRGGKQWFVPDCNFAANIDFSQGCISSWIPGEGATFDGEFFRNFWSFIPGECYYCYAERDHKAFSKTIYKFDEQRLRDELGGDFRYDFEDKSLRWGRHLDFLRFGKRVESWTPFTQNQFVRTLELMTETGTQGIIPTKTLEFLPDVSDLIKRTNSQILFSHSGHDELEIGLVMQDYTNEHRLEQARKYHEDGANVAIYLLVQGHKGITKEQQKILNLDIPVQLLFYNFTRKEIARRVTGEEWDNLKGGPKRIAKQMMLPNQGSDGTYISKENKLRLETIHPDWLDLIEDNNNPDVRMCHHTQDKTYCGGCFRTDGRIGRAPLNNYK